MPETPTIAVVHASIGSGHAVAAEAVSRSIGTLAPTAIVRTADILDFGAVRIDGNEATRSFSGAFAPVYDAMWGSRSLGRFVWGSTGWVTRALYSDFTDYLADVDPDVVVCTHALAANIAVGSGIRRNKRVPLICVPTDYGVHGFWPHRYVERFCVGHETIEETLVLDGVRARSIAVTGIPARPGFGTHVDTPVSLLRRGLSLPEDRLLVLVLAGASMSGPYARVKKLVSRTVEDLCAHSHVHVAVVTGKDEEFARELEDIARLERLENLTVLGFVTDMDRLMAAADLVMCKPGGLTCTEAVYSRVPLLLVGPAIGQERANVEFFGARGIAVHVDSDVDLVREFDSLVTDDARRERMRLATGSVSTVDAADRIARVALELT